MHDGRARSLALIALVSASACGPGKAPALAGPPPAPVSSAREIPAPLRSAPPLASAREESTIEPVAIEEPGLDASGCETLPLGPCARADVRARCRAVVASLEAAPRAVFSECARQIAPRTRLSAGCDESVGRCRERDARCGAARMAIANCERGVAGACERSAEVREVRLCWDRCTDGFPPSGVPFDARAARLRCAERCGGEPGQAMRKCRAEHAECAPLVRAEQACVAERNVDCDLPKACRSALDGACEKASTELSACREMAEKRP